MHIEPFARFRAYNEIFYIFLINTYLEPSNSTHKVISTLFGASFKWMEFQCRNQIMQSAYKKATKPNYGKRKLHHRLVDMKDGFWKEDTFLFRSGSRTTIDIYWIDWHAI